MSDFAARLVARAQGRGAIVTPRAPPRFAPEPGELARAESPGAWDGGAPEHGVESPAPPPLIDKPAYRAPVPPAAEASAPVAVAQEAMPAAAVRGGRVPAPAPSDAPERHALPAAAVPAVTPPARRADAVAEVSGGSPQAVSVPAFPRQAEAASEPASVAEPLPRSAAPPLAWLPAPEEERGSSPARPAAAANDRDPRHAAPAVLPTAPAEPPPPIVIEIGAVEFRTVQPPTPPAAPAPARPAPSLSLDAYLAQRASRPGGR